MGHPKKKVENYGNKLPVEKEKYKIRENKKRYNPLRKNKNEEEFLNEKTEE